MKFKHLAEMFHKNSAVEPERTAYMHKIDGAYVSVKYKEIAESVRNIAGGLASLGIKQGDKIGILSENRLEWALIDYACQTIGVVDVPLYPSLLPAQIAYILKDSESVAVFCSTQEQYGKVSEIRSECPNLKYVISMDLPAGDKNYTILQELIESGKKFLAENSGYLEAEMEKINTDDMCTIIYTSGTTGDPKGVMLTHGNFISNIEGGLGSIQVNDKDVFLSFLPLSHVFERMVGHYLAFYTRSTIAFAVGIDTVAENMGEVHPTVMASVPRLYEKIYARILENVENGPGVKRAIFYWALKVGKEYVGKIMNKQPISGSLAFKRNLAYKLVFSKLAERVGGNMRFFVSGGAPLSKEIGEFFGAAGLMILEGYGLTETSPVICVNKEDQFRFGTVGPRIFNVEVKIAEDGEILTRGPHVMLGYYNKEAETKEVLDDDGWFHTGDIGVISEDGMLTITDRKKNILVTSGGKNIAPAPIENALVTQKYVEQVMVIGDKRKFCSAVIVPSFEALETWAKANDVSYSNPSELVQNPQVKALLQSDVDKVNKQLASYESIKKFILCDKLFSIEDGTLTPSLKIKRKVVIEKMKDEIDKLYEV